MSSDLKPCPLCGRPVHIAEQTIGSVYHHSGALFQECAARIECVCGLSYEREWTEYKPVDGVWQIYPGNVHIQDAWNRRVNDEAHDH